MAEYIEREKLIASIKCRKMSEIVPNYLEEPTIQKAVISQGQAIKKIITEFPAADVVKVVRCRDCVYWECRGYDGRCEAYHNGLIRDYTNYDDFCSYGKRKEVTEE